MSGGAVTERIKPLLRLEGGKGQENARTVNESRIEPVLWNDRRETARHPCSGPRCPLLLGECEDPFRDSEQKKNMVSLSEAHSGLLWWRGGSVRAEQIVQLQ